MHRRPARAASSHRSYVIPQRPALTGALVGRLAASAARVDHIVRVAHRELGEDLAPQQMPNERQSATQRVRLSAKPGKSGAWTRKIAREGKGERFHSAARQDESVMLPTREILWFMRESAICERAFATLRTRTRAASGRYRQACSPMLVAMRACGSL